MHTHNAYRVIEAVLIIVVTTASVFIAATFLGTCVPENSPTETVNRDINNCITSQSLFLLLIPQGDASFKNESRGYFCPPAGDYTFFNDMATLMFNTQEVAVKQLFHQTGKRVTITWLVLLCM